MSGAAERSVLCSESSVKDQPASAILLLVREEDEPCLPREGCTVHTEAASSTAHTYAFSSSLMAERSADPGGGWEMKFQTATQKGEQYSQQEHYTYRKEMGEGKHSLRCLWARSSSLPSLR